MRLCFFNLIIMTEIDFALSQSKDTDIIELVGTVLWNKANEVSAFEDLSIPEQNFIYIDIFESEMLNGGLFDFFYNESGTYAHQALEAYTAIGADQTAELLNNAIKTFPELPVSKDIFQRRFLMHSLDSQTLKSWDHLSQSYYSLDEAIVSLLIAYIGANKTSFEY